MKKGYTLIEILTAIAIFILMITSAMTAFVSAFRAQKRVLDTREVIDGASFVIEYMARAIRMAKKDDVEIRGITKDCSGTPNDEVSYIITSSGSGIKFRNYKLNECQEFFLEAGRIIERKEGINTYLTPQGLQVSNLKFFYNPAVSEQPRITIFLEIQKGIDEKTRISLQTSVSKRDLDF